MDFLSENQNNLFILEMNDINNQETFNSDKNSNNNFIIEIIENKNSDQGVILNNNIDYSHNDKNINNAAKNSDNIIPIVLKQNQEKILEEQQNEKEIKKQDTKNDETRKEIKIHSMPQEKVILNFKINNNDLSNQKFFHGMDQILTEILAKNSGDIIQNLDEKEANLTKNLKNISGIIFEFDSPGGNAIDSLCLAEKIDFFKKELDIPLISHIKTAYSAGYMLASLISDEIFISKYGEIGAIGVYSKERNISKILDSLNLETIIFPSEGTSDVKFHDSTMNISEELKNIKIKNATRLLNQYFSDLREKRGEIFKNENDENFILFRSGFNLSSFESKDLGLVDSIGQFEDAKNSIKNIIKEKEREKLSTQIPNYIPAQIEPNLSFKIIDIKTDDLSKNNFFPKLNKVSSEFIELHEFDPYDFFEHNRNNQNFFSLLQDDKFLVQTAVQEYVKKIFSQ